jgi:retron-type reverse transcriptase
VVKFDIKGAFDNLSHTLLLKALRHHTDCKWILLYIERWLTAPCHYEDGRLEVRTKGTAQGGVGSPLRLNLVLPYVFDCWMQRHYPQPPFERYADDGLAHCQTETEASALKEALVARFAQGGLELHPDKTRIVYCQDEDRRGEYTHTKVDFLGYTFQVLLGSTLYDCRHGSHARDSQGPAGSHRDCSSNSSGAVLCLGCIDNRE